ncbi:tripartite tricarboxylate transporter TctB family protein [Brachybacterium sp. J144]|uniref:tripartite tricarboxylate transporter TctB family protein n=1 Tax=Brachybacterium sp. J144 TaxID=3116487 RepID=UPI002E7A2C2E|nr:tripartite tricarboxylate transporter TctB family protein [Brachybacterium sp. J144]MEE1650276.1 tripartite tricarboxylate transporter TctB family protein [Brachybacterium sp. J144]
MTAAAPNSTSPPPTAPTAPLRQNLLIGGLATLAGAIVIPYGASMPYIREGIPGPGLFPMLVGGLLILFGILLPATTWWGRGRDLRHRAELAAIAAADGADSAAAADGETAPGSSVPAVATDTPVEELPTVAVLDTDIGSDGPRRWINGAILMGGIVAYVLLAEPLGFSITMTLLVVAILLSLRARWWVALLTGVLTALGLWVLFEQILLVQLPDGLIRGF